MRNAIVMMSMLMVLIGCLNGCVNQQNLRTSTDSGKNTNEEEIQSRDKASMSEDLLSRGEELMNLGRYAEAEDYLQRAVSMGNQDADILLSLLSILGKISHYSYKDSLYRLEQYRKNNLTASRAYALIWLIESQNPEHRNSKVNAYYAIRDHLRVEADSDFATVIPEANEFVRQLDDLNGVVWTFDFKKDPMTDEPICSLKSNEESGV